MLLRRVASQILPDAYGPAGRLFEWARGTRVLNRFSELRRTEKLNRNEIKLLQQRKLRRLMENIEENCPWYRSHWANVGMTPSDVRTLDDLCKLPVMSRKDLRIAVNNGIVAENLGAMPVDRASSGGTTGEPVQVLMGRESRNVAGAAVLRYYDWWNVKGSDPMAVLWGRAEPQDMTARRRWMERTKELLASRLTLNTFFLDDKILLEHYTKISEFQPTILRGYANSLYTMACFIRAEKLPTWSGLRLVASTSELLTPSMRETMEDVYGAPVANYYGCGEVNGIAFECPGGRLMHITEEHVVLEALDSERAPVLDTPGRLVVTDLDNVAMPLVRYEIGDEGAITRKACPCGRASLVLQEITGRLSEELRLANGRKIAPSFWSVVLRPYRQVQQGCVRVLSESHLQIDLVLSDRIQADTMEYLRREVDRAVGESVQVEWREVERIPRVRSGKSPWVRRAEDELPDS